MTDDVPPDEPQPDEGPGAEVVPIESRRRLRPGPKQRVLTDDTIERLVFAFTACAYVPDACAYAAISESWFYECAARGRAYAEHIDAGGEIIEGEDLYLRLALQTDKARSEMKVSALASIRTAWEAGDWRAALAFLERSDPKRWLRLQKVEMSGPDGGPIQVDIGDLERRLAEYVEQRPLVIDNATVVSEVITAGAQAAMQYADDDDDEDYYFVPFADLSAFDFTEPE